MRSFVAIQGNANEGGRSRKFAGVFLFWFPRRSTNRRLGAAEQVIEQNSVEPESQTMLSRIQYSGEFPCSIKKANDVPVSLRRRGTRLQGTSLTSNLPKMNTPNIVSSKVWLLTRIFATPLRTVT